MIRYNTNISKGLYGNGILSTNSPLIAANVLEAECLAFNDMMASANILTEADAEESKKSFIEKIKSIFTKILDFIKNIKNKIKSLGSKTTKDIDEKKEKILNSGSDTKAVNESRSEAGEGVYKFNNYLNWFLTIGSKEYNNIMLKASEDSIINFSKFMRTRVNGFKEGKYEKKELLQFIDRTSGVVKDDIIESVDRLVDKKLKTAQVTNNHVTAAPAHKCKKFSDIPGAISNIFNSTFKYISSHPLKIRVITNSNGILDLAEPIQCNTGNISRRDLGDKSKASGMCKTLNIISKNVEGYTKFILDTYTEYESLITISLKNMEKSADGNKDVNDIIAAGTEYLTNYCSMLVNVNTIIYTNLCKLATNTVDNIVFLCKILKF